MPAPIRAKALQPGDTIAFISPSARINNDMLDVLARATGVLTDLGFKVRVFFNTDTGIQSSISNRLSEIRAAFSDPSIAGVCCTIGGTTFTELLPALLRDTELHATIRANPKVFWGYSDITGFHWFLYGMTGLRTFYGPAPFPELGEPNSHKDKDTPLAFCVENLTRAIASSEPLGVIPRSTTYAPRAAECFTNPTTTTPPALAPSPKWRWIRSGKGQGKLFGGLLTAMPRLQGVPALRPDWKGKIVFAEQALADDDASGVALVRIQAAFADLIASGVFDEAEGLVVGRPFGYDSAQQQEEYVKMLTELFCEGEMASKTFPILMNVDIGHTTPMVTLPFDATAVLDSEQDLFSVVEAGVV
ncbi:hypothetical protein K4F52_002423 [Lecanicillium sp. MT-2017a]|nr:hypothetical protein K4F52_002423 [Lecanicillium sp. MT-2017a]